MRIPTIVEQTPAESPLCGEIRGFGANGDSSLLCRAFLLVVATLDLAATERDDATITKKIIIFLLGATEEAAATIRVSTPNAMRYAHRPNHGALL